jgi:hypothetical protein
MAVDDNGNSTRKSLPYFDLPKHMRKVLYHDLVRDLLILHVRSAVALPPEPILNDVGLYISSLSCLLDPYTKNGEECVLTPTPKGQFGKTSKLQQQEPKDDEREAG